MAPKFIAVSRSGRSSRDVFQRHFKIDDEGELDASHVFSENCFNEWVRTRRQLPKSPSRAFQCAIRNVLTGANGCKPFDAKEEKAILRYLRGEHNHGWPCSTQKCRLGAAGWRYVAGWHEKNGNTISHLQEKSMQHQSSTVKENDVYSRIATLQIPPKSPLSTSYILPSFDAYSIFNQISPKESERLSPRMLFSCSNGYFNFHPATILQPSRQSFHHCDGLNYFQI